MESPVVVFAFRDLPSLVKKAVAIEDNISCDEIARKLYAKFLAGIADTDRYRVCKIHMAERGGSDNAICLGEMRAEKFAVLFFLSKLRNSSCVRINWRMVPLTPTGEIQPRTEKLGYDNIIEVEASYGLAIAEGLTEQILTFLHG